MICQRTDFENGSTKILGVLSVSDADIEQAEQRAFAEAYSGISYTDVETETQKALVARSLKYFAYVEISQDRNARLKINAQMTEQAQSYGNTDKGALLNVWAEGIKQAERDIVALTETFEKFTIKADIRI